MGIAVIGYPQILFFYTPYKDVSKMGQFISQISRSGTSVAEQIVYGNYHFIGILFTPYGVGKESSQIAVIRGSGNSDNFQYWFIPNYRNRSYTPVHIYAAGLLNEYRFWILSSGGASYGSGARSASHDIRVTPCNTILHQEIYNYLNFHNFYKLKGLSDEFSNSKTDERV